MIETTGATVKVDVTGTVSADAPVVHEWTDRERHGQRPFAPDSVQLTFWRSTVDGSITQRALWVRGSRLKADGTPGLRRGLAYFSDRTWGDRPEWLVSWVDANLEVGA